MMERANRRHPYGIVGDGKASRHLQAYFSLLKTPYKLWRRNSGRTPEAALKDCKKVFILIKDSEIEPFIRKNPFLETKTLIHFSGSFSLRQAIGIHPFMPLAGPPRPFASSPYRRPLCGKQCFSHSAKGRGKPLSLAQYRRMPFALEPGAPSLKKIIPEFKNPSFRIPKKGRALYHALCVMGANLPVILWRKVLNDLNGKFHIPKKYIFYYFRAALDNFERDPAAALSGPLERKDIKTVRANLKALKNDPFRKVYAAFAGIYRKGCNCSPPPFPPPSRGRVRVGGTFRRT